MRQPHCADAAARNHLAGTAIQRSSHSALPTRWLCGCSEDRGAHMRRGLRVQVAGHSGIWSSHQSRSHHAAAPIAIHTSRVMAPKTSFTRRPSSSPTCGRCRPGVRVRSRSEGTDEQLSITCQPCLSAGGSMRADEDQQQGENELEDDQTRAGETLEEVLQFAHGCTPALPDRLACTLLWYMGLSARADGVLAGLTTLSR